jgi:hypothetical protein
MRGGNADEKKAGADKGGWKATMQWYDGGGLKYSPNAVDFNP